MWHQLSQKMTIEGAAAKWHWLCACESGYVLGAALLLKLSCFGFLQRHLQLWNLLIHIHLRFSNVFKFCPFLVQTWLTQTLGIIQFILSPFLTWSSFDLILISAWWYLEDKYFMKRYLPWKGWKPLLKHTLQHDYLLVFSPKPLTPVLPENITANTFSHLNSSQRCVDW